MANFDLAAMALKAVCPTNDILYDDKGLPSVNSYGTGDLLVNVSVYIPETLSPSEKDIMNGLENSPNFQPKKSVKEKIFDKFRHMFD
mgnify:CR=1 FL=1